MNVNDRFRAMADEVALNNMDDPEVARGIRFLDAKARERGVSFYAMVLKALQAYEAGRLAQEWRAGL